MLLNSAGVVQILNRPLNAGLFCRSATKPTSLLPFLNGEHGYSFYENTLVGRGFREGERDDAAAGGATGFRSSGGDHDKLAVIYHVGAGSGIAPKR